MIETTCECGGTVQCKEPVQTDHDEVARKGIESVVHRCWAALPDPDRPGKTKLCRRPFQLRRQEGGWVLVEAGAS